MPDPTTSKLLRAWQIARLALIGFRHHVWRVVGTAIDPEGGKHDQRAAVALGKAVTRFLKSDVSVLGAEKLDGLERYVVCANHTSYVDWALILGHFPVAPRFVARREVAKVPVVGSYLRARGILIDRKRGNHAQRTLAEALKEDSPWPLLIFPEGTRSRDGNMKPFRRAGMRLLTESDFPIVPIVLVGSWETFPPLASAAYTGTKMRIVIGDPVMPDEHSPDERARTVEERMRSLYAEHRAQIVASLTEAQAKAFAGKLAGAGESEQRA